MGSSTERQTRKYILFLIHLQNTSAFSITNFQLDGWTFCWTPCRMKMSHLLKFFFFWKRIGKPYKTKPQLNRPPLEMGKKAIKSYLLCQKGGIYMWRFFFSLLVSFQTHPSLKNNGSINNIKWEITGFPALFIVKVELHKWKEVEMVSYEKWFATCT